MGEEKSINTKQRDKNIHRRNGILARAHTHTNEQTDVRARSPYWTSDVVPHRCGYEVHGLNQTHSHKQCSDGIRKTMKESGPTRDDRSERLAHRLAVVHDIVWNVITQRERLDATDRDKVRETKRDESAWRLRRAHVIHTHTRVQIQSAYASSSICWRRVYWCAGCCCPPCVNTLSCACTSTSRLTGRKQRKKTQAFDIADWPGGDAVERAFALPSTLARHSRQQQQQHKDQCARTLKFEPKRLLDKSCAVSVSFVRFLWGGRAVALTWKVEMIDNVNANGYTQWETVWMLIMNRTQTAACCMTRHVLGRVLLSRVLLALETARSVLCEEFQMRFQIDNVMFQLVWCVWVCVRVWPIASG